MTEIKVGQIWMEDDQYKILLVKPKQVILECDDELYIEEVEFFQANYKLIYDPYWGDMEGWRIVTKEEKDKYNVPYPAEVIKGQGLWRPSERVGRSFTIGIPYRVPADYEFKKEPEWTFKNDGRCVAIRKCDDVTFWVKKDVFNAIVKHGKEVE